MLWAPCNLHVAIGLLVHANWKDPSEHPGDTNPDNEISSTETDIGMRLMTGKPPPRRRRRGVCVCVCVCWGGGACAALHEEDATIQQDDRARQAEVIVHQGFSSSPP